MDCIFCKIASGEIPCKKIYEDDKVIAFYDIEPQAPVHFLVIPKRHITSAAEITSENSSLVAYIYEIIAKIAKDLSLKSGYRVLTNVGKDAGQTVFHMHFHVLAGRPLNVTLG